MIKLFFDPTLLESPKSETYWAYNQIDTVERPEYSRYIISRNNLITESSLEESDFVFIPYKWDGNHNFTHGELCKKAVAANKKIIAFFNDDHEGYIGMPNSSSFYLFRTSTSMKTRKENEIVMPAFSEEFSFQPPNHKAIKHQVVSFCGNIQDPHRYPIFLELERQANLVKNFIYRNGFWAPEIVDKRLAKKHFIDNLLRGLFGVCIRGKGNFSYRLYETLALGRIPIIINTDLQLPLKQSVDWGKHAIIVEKTDIPQLNQKIQNFLADVDPVEVCLSNKQLYDEYFSPCGLLKHFNLYLQESKV